MVTRLKAQICDPSLESEATLKATAQDKAKTEDNITALRAVVAKIIVAQNQPKNDFASMFTAILGKGAEQLLRPVGITADDLKKSVTKA